jgi:hypothetical protein
VNQVHVFVSFDVDHDNDCKDRLLSQATPAGSHFAIDDWSIREIATDWQDKTTKRISNVDVLFVICGEHTDTAQNVNYEIAVAREQNKPYLLLDGRPGRSTNPRRHSKAIRSSTGVRTRCGHPSTPPGTEPHADPYHSATRLPTVKSGVRTTLVTRRAGISSLSS